MAGRYYSYISFTVISARNGPFAFGNDPVDC